MYKIGHKPECEVINDSTDVVYKMKDTNENSKMFSRSKVIGNKSGIVNNPN